MFYSPANITQALNHHCRHTKSSEKSEQCRVFYQKAVNKGLASIKVTISELQSLILHVKTLHPYEPSATVRGEAASWNTYQWTRESICGPVKFPVKCSMNTGKFCSFLYGVGLHRCPVHSVSVAAVCAWQELHYMTWQRRWREAGRSQMTSSSSKITFTS